MIFNVGYNVISVVLVNSFCYISTVLDTAGQEVSIR